MMLRSSLAVALAIGLVAARNIPSTHVVHEEQMPHWAAAWDKGDRLDESVMLPMRFGLKQSSLEQGRQRLLEISNPKSADFGMHMTAEEVIDLFAPAQSKVDAVIKWLSEAGISAGRITQSTNKQWLQLDANVSEVENLLHANYHVYHHVSTGTKAVACPVYHLPVHVQDHIDYVTPGIKLRVDPTKLTKSKRSLDRRDGHGSKIGRLPVALEKLAGLPPLNSSVCDKYITNQCIRDQYSVPAGSKAAAGNELGIFESLDDHYSKRDLDVFFSTLFPTIPNGTYPTEMLIDGAVGAAQTIDEIGGESNLDFQSAWPLIWPQKTVLFQTDDEYYEVNQTTQTTPYLGFWNTFFDALDGSYCTYSAYGETGDCTAAECLDPQYPDPNPGGYTGQRQCGVYKPTNVISISYGGGEGDLPAYYIKRQCDEIMKLGLQGVTVVISSGDDGVGSYDGDGGYANGCAGPNGKVFYPAADATCPYLLTVGSTELSPPVAGLYHEVSTTHFPSGGGFSNYFDEPDYQKTAVTTYFDSVNLNFTGYTDPGTNFSTVGNGVYKIGGRGYPDVSAIGWNFISRSNDTWGKVGGTSLAAPIWASLLTLINEERLAVGKKSMGFINPTLYAHPEVFTDIVNGSNPACKSTGFLTAKGWDPVSGLGSPVYPKLLDLLLSLP